MTEHEQQRLVRHRLAILRHAEEVSGNVAGTCRYYGISRQCFYKWRNRYDELGEDGLRDRSSRPHHSPNETNAEVVGKIVYLRRLGINRLPASRRHKRHVDRWKRYEKPLPGHRVQVDVKFLGRIGESRRKHYQYTAIDDCTRIRVLRIYDRCNQVTSIRFLDYVLEKLPFQVEVIQTDNGAEFQSRFHYHVLDRGIGHVYIKPASPHLNGKVERSHRIDNEEFYRMLQGVLIDDTELFNDRLQEWEDFYNFNRPLGGLNGDTPYEKLRKKTTAPV